MEKFCLVRRVCDQEGPIVLMLVPSKCLLSKFYCYMYKSYSSYCVLTVSNVFLLLSSPQVSGCGGLPSLSVPSVDEPLSSVAGHLSSVVPASFSTEFTKLFVDFKESLFDKFTDISNQFASLCNSAATSGFCWARTEVVLRTSTRKVSFGSDALYNNPDIIINGFDNDITSIRDDFSTHIASLQLQTNSTRSFLGTLTSTFTSSDPSSGWRCLPSAIVVVICLFVLILSNIFVP